MSISLGRAQRNASATAKAREPNLEAFYGKLLATSFRPGELDFEVELIRPRVDTIALGSMLESLEWTDDGSTQDQADEAGLSGQVVLRRPDPEDPASLPIARAHLLRVHVRWDGRRYELWTMRCKAPSTTGGVVTVDLEDDLAPVTRGRRRYLYRSTKARPHGWFGHDAIIDAARHDGVKLGSIVKCKRRMGKIDVTGSFRDLVAKVYEHEHNVTGKTYIWRMRDGRFEVVNYKRNTTLYVFDEQSREITFTPEPRVRKPITVLTGKARLGKGKSAKLIRHTEHREDMVRRFGYVHKVRNYGRVESTGELVDLIKRDLAKQYRVDFKVQLSASGNPFLRRGDGAQVLFKREGLEGAQSFVFCTSVTHRVAGAQFTTDAEFSMDDPFVADKLAREKEALDKAAKRRAGAAGSPSTGGSVVGASVFSGSPGYRGDDLNSGPLAFAELGMGHNLGGLAYRAELQIEYNGRSVVAQKLDIGAGGGDVQGHRRDIDLHERTAAALGFPSGVDLVTIRRV